MAETMALVDRIVDRYGLADSNGAETGIPGVEVHYRDSPISRCKLLYNSGVIIILSGRKVAHLGHRRFVYDADNYLALGLPLAMECQTIASQEEPLFLIYVRVDPLLVREIVRTTNMSIAAPTPREPAVAAAPLDPDMADVVHRLLRHLCSDEDTAVLGAGTAREVVYRALLGPAGHALSGLANHEGPTARVADVVQVLQERYREHFSVDDLARMAGMSPSAFHRSFRDVVDDSPLQYLKKLRLTQASALIVHQGYRVRAAASAVGYESAAQFSRDFKSHFGVNAVDAKKLGYAFVQQPLPPPARSA